LSSFSPLILGIGGTSRPNSTSELAVRCALSAAEAMGARTKLIDGALISGLPLYVPGRTERTADECAFIGDSVSDVLAGRLAGVAVIGFANRPPRSAP